MTVTPQSEITLVRTPLINDYKNSFDWRNGKSAQTSYFNSLKISNGKTFKEYTYVKKDNVIRVDENIDNIINYNYLFYTNIGFTSKTYYCFITNMEYLNENCTAVYFETDVLQTYFFDITFKESFVEREHVSDDSVGLHTQPEGLELGEYIGVQAPNTYLDNPDDFVICMAVSDFPSGVDTFPDTKLYNRLYSGLYYLIFDDPNDCTKAIEKYTSDKKVEAIYSLFMIPSSSVNLNSVDTTWNIDDEYINVTYLGMKSDLEQGNDVLGTILLEKPSTLANNYSPKNNKLLTYPFSYLNVTNNSGTTIPFHYEDFSYKSEEIPDKTFIYFQIYGVVTPSMNMKLVPLNYKNINIAYNFGINLGKIPICSWVSDTYLNWLTQNGLNNAIDIGSNVISSIGSAITGNISGFIGGASGIYNAIHERYLAQTAPDQAKGNVNNGDLNYSMANEGGITLYFMSIKKEYAEIIDGYFDRYGYKVNEFKVPQFNCRHYWNYIKTIECNIEGNIPQDALIKIKNIFDNGITFWHDTDKMEDYDYDNHLYNPLE